MTRHWWVNHKQTFDHEINGGYVWAPRMMQNGRSSHFYDNLRRASPDDTVVSFANAMVEFIGKVSDYALSTPKPDSFGIAGVAWLDSGWMLPVAWRPVTVPFKPSQFTEYLPASLQKNTRLSK